MTSTACKNVRLTLALVGTPGIHCVLSSSHSTGMLRNDFIGCWLKRLQVYLLTLFLPWMQQVLAVEYAGPFVAEIGQAQREPQQSLRDCQQLKRAGVAPLASCFSSCQLLHLAEWLLKSPSDALNYKRHFTTFHLLLGCGNPGMARRCSGCNWYEQGNVTCSICV